jgi:hypothetical protein
MLLHRREPSHRVLIKPSLCLLPVLERLSPIIHALIHHWVARRPRVFVLDYRKLDLLLLGMLSILPAIALALGTVVVAVVE